MRLGTKVWLAMFVAVAGLMLNTTAAVAAPAAPYYSSQLNISAERWNQRSAIQLHGSGFAPSEQVKIDFAGPLTTATTSASGEFEVASIVPQVATSTYPVTATGQTSGAVATYYFSVQPFNAWGEPSSYYVPTGTTLTFSGHRFGNGETVDVVFEGNNVTHTVADATGEFTNQGSFVVPDRLANSTVTFSMVGRTSGATATFTVSIGGIGSRGQPGDGDGDGTSGGPGEVITPVSLVTTELLTMMPGQHGWQAIYWKGASNEDVCNFTVTAASADGATFRYPAGQTNTTPSHDFGLLKNETDYTALLVNAPAGATAAIPLALHATYKSCTTNTPAVLDVTTSLPVAENTGAPFTQDTVEVGPVALGTGQWVNVYYTGYSPNLTNFQVRVTQSGGIDVRYPANRAYTTPSKESALDVLDTDYVAIHLDTVNLSHPNTYILPLSTTFGSPTQTVASNLAVIVS